MSEEFHVEHVGMSADNNLFPYTQLITKALEAKGWLKFRVHAHTEDRPRDRIHISFNATHMSSIDVTIVVDDRGARVALYVYNIVKLPNAQPAELYQLIQKIHANYLFARWFFDEDDNTLQAEWYTHMNEDIESARIVATAVGRLASLVDDVYPLIMQTCSELGLFK